MFEARKVAGSVKYKQSETVLSYKVSLFIQFIQSLNKDNLCIWFHWA